MITINESKLQYKADDGRVTRRIPEHFIKRTVIFELDGEERRLDIDKSELSRGATEDEVLAYLEANTEKSEITNKQLENLQKTVDSLILDNLMRGL